ncbi:MAG: MFS transporter [Isosphaeraceae bacterium]
MTRFPPRSLLILTLAHALVDAYASLVQPLWPDLQRSLALGDGSMQGVFILWTMATSMSQILFGYVGDRIQGRWLLWGGTAVGIVGTSAVGLVGSPWGLGLLLVTAGLGIAAFHPEAAAMAGASAPGDRSRAMSLFAVGGYLGQAAGPACSGVVSTRLGMSALAWGAIGGLLVLATLAAGMSGGSQGEGARSTALKPVSLAALIRGRRRAVGLLLSVGVLRVMPVAGLPLAIAYLLKARGASNAEIGMAQSVFLAAVGAGSLGCALCVRGSRERVALWLLPVLTAPFLLAAPTSGYATLVVSTGTSGFLLGAVMPILVGYGQRLMPEGQRVASSITMGVTWGLGGVVVAGLMGACNHLGRPGLAFGVFAMATAGSSALCGWLPLAEAERVPAV